jgi:predicted GIY-YIG superfamily endonuclease
MAKIATLTLSGKSGDKYDFNVYQFDTSFKQVAAVYAVTKRYKKQDGSHTHTIIYIGQTDNLSERFDDHHKAECFSRNNANCICVHKETSEKERLRIESDLLAARDPDCND